MKRAREHIEAEERDEHKALKEGVRDLIRLDRYERQAWSRQKQAIYELLNRQINRNYESGTGLPLTAEDTRDRDHRNETNMNP